MIKTIGYIVIILAVAGAAYFLFSGRPPTSNIKLSSEQKDALQKIQPQISQEEETFLSLLEKNAISGGPPKDGIPAIEKPEYSDAVEADQWLLPNDVVFGIAHDGFVAAYPQRILVWHEIVNETINDEKISITYCPLTGTTLAFNGRIAPEMQSTLGVSGKLVNSNLLMYDRSTDSYWPQILGKAITGPAKGKKLEEFSIVWTSWEKWKKQHPNTKVLSQDTGFIRDYGVRGDPYGSYLRQDRGYYTSEGTVFRPIYEDNRLPLKTVVVGVRDSKGNAVAIVKDKLRQEKTIEAELGGKTVVVAYDDALDFYTAQIKETGEWINAFDAMWFAWYAFYPKTNLIQ